MTFPTFVKKVYVKLARKKNVKANFIKTIPNNISILEIGPFYSPMCRGANIKYFDIIDQKALQSRALTLNPNINIDKVPYIDYVDSTGDLSIIQETFDGVVSSHVIEHQLDFIDHLQKVTKLLNKGGKYYMIIPDKRYCFDHFNKESNIADINKCKC